jgi:hypothetical protein
VSAAGESARCPLGRWEHASRGSAHPGSGCESCAYTSSRASAVTRTTWWRAPWRLSGENTRNSPPLSPSAGSHAARTSLEPSPLRSAITGSGRLAPARCTVSVLASCSTHQAGSKCTTPSCCSTAIRRQGQRRVSIESKQPLAGRTWSEKSTHRPETTRTARSRLCMAGDGGAERDAPACQLHSESMRLGGAQLALRVVTWKLSPETEPALYRGRIR